MDTVKFSCPKCGARLTAPRRQTRMVRATCPYCETATLLEPAGRSAPALPRARNDREDRRPRRDYDDYDDYAPDRSAQQSSATLIWALVAGGAALLILGGIAVATVVVMVAGSNQATVADAGQDKLIEPAPLVEPPVLPVAGEVNPGKPDNQDNPANVPLAPLPPVVTPTRPVVPRNHDDWPQDLELAKQMAAREDKDLLVLFDGSDWCPYSQRLARQVFFTSTFHSRAPQSFVLVFIDSPRGPAARAKVQDPQRNAQLQERLGIEGYPTVVLMDAQGRPYAVTGYRPGSADAYCSHLEQLQQIRVRRDDLLAAIARAPGSARLTAAGKALDFLVANDEAVGERADLLSAYADLFQGWVALARQHDPGNRTGQAEKFFLTNWMVQLRRIKPTNAREFLPSLDRLDEWCKNNKVTDTNLVAALYLGAGRLLSLAGLNARAARCFKSGLACNPADPNLRAVLKKAATGRLVLSSGTGFVVSPDGLLLTNHHVIEGPGRVMVQPSRGGQAVGDPLPATVVAKDPEKDIALIRVNLPPRVRLQPVNVAGRRSPQRGENVLVLGYPLADRLGSGIKLTEGVITGLPEASTANLLLISAKVNPGNSGGPLCDVAGNVIGMVTAKSPSGERIESYGMALPASELEAFLRRHLPSYRPAPYRTRRARNWAEVDRRISPSVLQILKVI
jgi:thiol-disulfide isomerase/thioredoxin